MLNTIINQDCMIGLKTLESESVNCCVTSPPYFGLRDYGHGDQIGLEDTPELYVAKIVDVFREVRRVLNKDGTLWLNLGDSYAGSWGNYGGTNRGAGKQRQVQSGSRVENESWDARTTFKPKACNGFPGIKPKDLIGIPWMVAFALRADGWYLRQDIIWNKPNPMPESVTDRCSKSHEYVFLLSKSDRYYYDQQSILQPIAESTRNDYRFGKEDEYVAGRPERGYNGAASRGASLLSRKSGNIARKDRPGTPDDTSRNQKGSVPWEGTMANKKSVWTVTTRPFKEAHFATFPEELIVDMIKAGCPIDGVVLDPFMGAGTTALVARKLNRNFVGFELNENYIKIANKRLREELGMFL